MDNELIKKILVTLAYYDCLDYPLTSFEIWKYLTKTNNTDNAENNEKYLLAEVIRELGDEKLKDFIEEFRGFYFLKGRRELIRRRINGNKSASEKMKKLRRVVWLLRFVPYVRMIGVTGRLAMKNTEKESDWDLLIVLQGGKIWTGRTLVTFTTHLLGKRRYGDKIRDRVCLNYFITDKSLEITTKDMFSAHEYFFILPLFDTGIFRKFQLKNRWIRNFKVNYGLVEQDNLKILSDSKISEILRKIGEIILNFQVLESWLGRWQKDKIMRNPKTNRKGSLIQANDDALIFLPSPQGPKIFDKFVNRIGKIQQR